MQDALTRGREAYARREWSEAYDLLLRVDGEGLLQPADMVKLARAAHLVGIDDACDEMLARAHSAFLGNGELEKAAESAFWLAFRLLQAGEHARGSGWLARAQRLVDESGIDGPICGFLLLPTVLEALSKGNADEAFQHSTRAYEIGRRFADPDLTTLGRLGRGQSLVRMGRVSEGISLLDEVMVGVTAGEVSPLIVGIVYCAVIEACHEVFDLRRAQEWTEAFTRWCAAEPDIMPFRGECLTRRAEILQVRGHWEDAIDEARRAGDHLTRPPGQRAAGAAFYRQAELLRLRGEFAAAERAFREAERWGRSPQPGVALLRLDQGQTQLARDTIRGALQSAPDRRKRSTLLAAYVEIHLAAGEVQEAARAADELAEIAQSFDAPYLSAVAGLARGSTLCAAARHQEALSALRPVLTTFREMGAPYEAARTLVEIALACRALGDEAACKLELEEARATFERLEARPDLERIATLAGHSAPPDGLTSREVEVLALVATGMTNREIAGELFISEKTVARHLSNIFNKLGISSRAAATAYAYERGLHRKPST